MRATRRRVSSTSFRKGFQVRATSSARRKCDRCSSRDWRHISSVCHLVSTTISRRSSVADRKRRRSGRQVLREHRPVAPAGEQAGDGNVFVERFPMQAVLADLHCAAIGRLASNSRGNQASGTPSVRPSSNSTHIWSASKRTSVALGEIVMPCAFDLGAEIGYDSAEHHECRRVRSRQ